MAQDFVLEEKIVNVLACYRALDLSQGESTFDGVLLSIIGSVKLLDDYTKGAPAVQLWNSEIDKRAQQVIRDAEKAANQS